MVVIVGGGLAGQRFAETLRRGGHESALRIVCARAPGALRPAAAVQGAARAAIAPRRRSRFRDDAWYADHDVELLLGHASHGRGPMARRLTLTRRRRRCAYDRLLVATGCGAATLRH